MNKISDFLAGIKVLEEVDSPINGKLTVIKSMAFGTYIQAGGLTQSGGIVKKIWDKTLRKVKSSKSKIKSCLILGLGGGSLVELVGNYWPEAKITAVDIDPKIVELGEKYLGLDRIKVAIKIEDAFDYLTTHHSPHTKHFDLILIDLYNGDKYPDKFEKEDILKLIHKLLTEKGFAVFNRLYYGDKRSLAVKFMHKLETMFSNVEVVYPEANVMYVCSK